MTASSSQAIAAEMKAKATMDSKPIFGKDGKFKPSVPQGAVRPKPVQVPEKAKP
ncbi:MAG: hypothetical protein ABSF53_24975 [Terracidiphilus sp.]